ncbi:sporulation integral membrane protein YlbJ [Desulfitispora alkaliphila]|uniref:sporulation integral membrane protein YlbJ n=1 Tax=Desulfitispora alkaliphila TaxID=622674 RepID=UPI003D1DF216
MRIKLLLILSLIIIAITMILNPKAVFLAASNGLEIWFTILIPSLLPFFIIANLLISISFVQFMGALLEPLMRPLFNVPGAGGFVMAIGFTSGSPLGALMAIDLRKEQLCSKWEAERLMAFTNNSSPLFMVSAVAVGMFGKPALGAVFAIGHYLANLTIGIILGHLSRIKDPVIQKKEHPFSSTVLYAYKKMVYSKNFEIGTMLKDAINKSIQTILAIGGFVLLFSVLIEAFNILGISKYMYEFLSIALTLVSITPELASGLTIGFFEITLGIKQIVKTDAPLQHQLIITAFILAWNGISIHAQIASFASSTDIQMRTYVLSRVAHSFIAAFYTFLLWNPLYPVFTGSEFSFFLPLPQSAFGFFIFGSMAFVAISLLMIIVSVFIVIARAIIRALKRA